jgi:hypothetical protein
MRGGNSTITNKKGAYQSTFLTYNNILITQPNNSSREYLRHGRI